MAWGKKEETELGERGKAQTKRMQRKGTPANESKSSFEGSGRKKKDG